MLVLFADCGEVAALTSLDIFNEVRTAPLFSGGRFFRMFVERWQSGRMQLPAKQLAGESWPESSNLSLSVFHAKKVLPPSLVRILEEGGTPPSN